MMRSSLLRVVFGLLAFLCVQADRAVAGNDAYVGEVGTFAFGFCPEGWMPLNGQILPISRNEVLFQLLGTTFGGDGKTSFALPTAKPVFSADGTTTMVQCVATLSLPGAAAPEPAQTNGEPATTAQAAGKSMAASAAVGQSAGKAGTRRPTGLTGVLAPSQATQTGTLQAPAGSYTAPSVAVGGPQTGLYSPSSGTLGFVGSSNCTQGMLPCVGPTVIDPNGMLVIGASAPTIPVSGPTHSIAHSMEINCVGKTASNGTTCLPPMIISEYISTGSQDNPANENVMFYRSRGTTLGGVGAVEPGDLLLNITAYGDDGTGFNPGNQAGDWYVQVSNNCGPVSPGHVPTRMFFMTEGAGGAVDTKGLQIECNQDVSVPNGLLTANMGLVVNDPNTNRGLLNFTSLATGSIWSGNLKIMNTGQQVTTFLNATNPGTNENIAHLTFNAFNTSSQQMTFAQVVAATYGQPNAGAENGRLELQTIVNGTSTAQLNVANGIVLPDVGHRRPQGTGTLNITGPLYVGDVSVIDASRNARFTGISGSGPVSFSGISTTSGGNQPLCIDGSGNVYRGSGGGC